MADSNDTFAAIPASRRFEELFQNLPIACLGFDAEGTLMEWNRAAEQLFQLGTTQMLGSNVFDLLSPTEPSDLLHEIIGGIFQDTKTANFDWQILDQGATVRSLHCSVFPLPSQSGAAGGAILACLDLTAQRAYERQIEEQLLRLNEYSLEIEQSRWDLEEANRKLAALAATDGLTGLLNHRAFQTALGKETIRSQRDGRPFSIILLDVDHFKQYNDTYGHPEGDEVLKGVANIMLGASRGSDTVARYGGEEFAVILPGADEAGSMILAERLCEAIAGAYWPKRTITASIGVCTYDGTQTIPQLISLTDQALYASKAAGRNRVTHARSLPKAKAA